LLIVGTILMFVGLLFNCY